MVYGFGEKKTPDAFVAACGKFTYTEVLRPASAEVAAVPEPSAPQPKSNGAPFAPVAAEPAPTATPARPADNQQDYSAPNAYLPTHQSTIHPNTCLRIVTRLGRSGRQRS